MQGTTMPETSTKPYLLRALYEWCTDNGYTPHIAVRVDQHTRVPREFVRDGEIVLNISFDATNQLQMGNEAIEFSARFSGKPHKIEVPIANVLAIYARENGQGMAFPVEEAPMDGEEESDIDASEAIPLESVPSSELITDASHAQTSTPAQGPGSGPDAPKTGRPHLKVIK
jgi:stringent starvation protein B